MGRRWNLGFGAVAIAAATVAIRIPVLLSSRHATFDEGVYGVSVLAMRDGAVPFRDVFSSQGPAFLPTLWLFDSAGFGHPDALRIGMVVVGVALALGVFVVARRAAGEGGFFSSLVAAAVVATSSAGVAAAGPVQSDGVALMFGVWAIAVLLGAARLGRWRPVVVGLLLGAAVAVKSLFVFPIVLAVVWQYARQRAWTQLAAATASAVLLGVLVSLPWGIGNVWDQFVRFHLEVERDRIPWSNLRNLAELMWSRDVIFVWVAAVALAVLAIRIVTRQGPLGDPAARSMVVVWLAATVLLIVFGTEFNTGFYRFLIFLIVPAMVGFAILRPPRWATAATLLVAVLLVPVHRDDRAVYVHTRALSPVEHEVVAHLEALPPAALVITDEPGLAWVAGRHPPPHLVDPSYARLGTSYLTTEDLLAGAARDDVCAVLFFSGRFDSVEPDLAGNLAGYELQTLWGEWRRLYVKQACAR